MNLGIVTKFYALDDAISVLLRKQGIDFGKKHNIARLKILFVVEPF